MVSSALIIARLVVSLAEAGSISQPASSQAYYRMSLERPPLTTVRVRAVLPMNGTALLMSTTRPGNIPELGERGWPALVEGLRVTDSAGRSLELRPAGAGGWELEAAYRGTISLDYRVDFSLVARQGWPAPREGGYADTSAAIYIGRSLFISTEAMDTTVVEFEAPARWRVLGPWMRKGDNRFLVASQDELIDNLLAVTRQASSEVREGGFRLHVLGLGRWQGAREQVDDAMRRVVPRLVQMMAWKGSADYLVVLLPQPETGGESFRSSFAMTLEAPPTPENRPAWARLIAHEIFHFWNGWRLRGDDYQGSQWFQEGFTEYPAVLALATAGLTTETQFLRQLSDHVANYRRLATPLAAPDQRKGPPLYSGGALVALSWDILIRKETHGRRSLADFLQGLWRRTEGGRRPYSIPDIVAALNEIAPRDWQGDIDRFVAGRDPLPLSDLLALAGLRLLDVNGAPVIERDPAAGAEARRVWRGLLED